MSSYWMFPVDYDVRSASLDFIVEKRRFTQDDWKEYEKDYSGYEDEDSEAPTERYPESTVAPSVDIPLEDFEELDTFDMSDKDRIVLDLMHVTGYID